jgi:hypothetical protein
LSIQQQQHEQHQQPLPPQQQQQQQHAEPVPPTNHSQLARELPHLSAPLPDLSGAVLLASACAGTVMAFNRFIADVGLPEFLYQMYIVFSSAHLRHLSTAR